MTTATGPREPAFFLSVNGKIENARKGARVIQGMHLEGYIMRDLLYRSAPLDPAALRRTLRDSQERR